MMSNTTECSESHLRFTICSLLSLPHSLSLAARNISLGNICETQYTEELMAKLCPRLTDFCRPKNSEQKSPNAFFSATYRSRDIYWLFDSANVPLRCRSEWGDRRSVALATPTPESRCTGLALTNVLNISRTVHRRRKQPRGFLFRIPRSIDFH